MIVKVGEFRTDEETGEYGGTQWNAEESSDGLCDFVVVDVETVGRAGDGVDVEDGEWGEEDDLQDGVDADEDGAVVPVALGEGCPYQHLYFSK